MKVLVIAKAPVAGRVKTRLCPPLTHAQAAQVAASALHDTFLAVMASAADEVVVAFDGDPRPWVPAGLRVLPQRGETFAERLTLAWEDCGGPAVQIGMDTPQVTASMLDAAMATLAGPPCQSVLGLAEDGGWWALGMDTPHPDVFDGIEMSTPHTGQDQRRRLEQLGLAPVLLPSLRDVDTWEDAVAVAGLAPTTFFAAAVVAISPWPPASPAPGRRVPSPGP
ncbi:MAG: TIGR04282 family arsenosugar biosynthesis glycosyltransferase [Candidatus Phosphoribacter sp.]